MPSILDRRFDAAAAAITGPGGLLTAARDERGLLHVPALPATVPGFFDLTCAMNGAATAVIAGDERLTFAQLNEQANAAARALVGAHEVRPGDRVGIAMRNAPAWIVAYMAVLKAGGVATLLNGWWQRHELAHALRLTEPALVIADAPRAARVAEAGHAGAVLTLPIERPVTEAMASLTLPGHEDAVLPTIAPDDDATILFTSGSTGEAKGAVSTHRALTTGVYNITAALASIKALMIADGREAAVAHPVALLSVPFFHVTGEVPLLLTSFIVGRAMVLMTKWDAGEALRLIQEHRVTYFLGVPTMSLELLTHPDRDKHDLSTLNDLGAGGAPRPVAHVERMRAEMTAQPQLGYGLTETNAVGCSNFWSNYAEKPASTGRAQPFVEVAIMDDARTPVPQGDPGEVAIRSGANVRGYWRNEAATAAAFTDDGYFLTGDIGYLDEDGYLFIVDRKKDIIIRGGENISCQEVEAAIYAHPAVAEACVFGLHDERLGEVPGGAVHLEPDEELGEAGLREFLEGKLAAYKLPVAMWFYAEPLPKLGTGKIDKVGLRNRHRQEP